MRIVATMFLSRTPPGVSSSSRAGARTGKVPRRLLSVRACAAPPSKEKQPAAEPSKEGADKVVIKAPPPPAPGSDYIVGPYGSGRVSIDGACLLCLLSRSLYPPRDAAI